MLIWCLVWCLSCLHSYRVSSPLKFHVSMPLDSYSIPLDISLFYRGFLFSRYLSTHSPIHWTIFLNSLFDRHLLDTYLNSSKFLAINTSRYIELLFSTPSRYQLDQSRYLILYILKGQLDFVLTQTLRYYSLHSRSKTFFFTKTLLPSFFLAFFKLQFVGKRS